jgi:hypothetical protein
MNMINVSKISLAAAMAMAIAGCDVAVYSPQPQPQAVVYAAPPDQQVVVADAPPPVVYEQAPPPPEVGVVWIGPEYVWSGRQYELRHGHWDHPPQGHRNWTASHYEHGQHGYVYVAGRWD